MGTLQMRCHCGVVVEIVHVSLQVCSLLSLAVNALPVGRPSLEVQCYMHSNRNMQSVVDTEVQPYVAVSCALGIVVSLAVQALLTLFNGIHRW